MSKTKRGIVWGVTVALLAAGATFLGTLLGVANRAGGEDGIGGILASVRDPKGEFGDRARVNILLIGKDYNYTNKGILYTKQARSDTLVMLSLDLDRHRVSALSIPRDTKIGARDFDKINAAYAHGGAPRAVEAVSGLLGVRPDFYVALKPDAVKTIVDQLGGVEVEVLDWMKYHDSWANLHVDLAPGRYVINGEQAVGYTRFRKVDDIKRTPDGRPVFGRSGQPIRLRDVPPSKEAGDERRMARQQLLLKAMAAKARSRFADPRRWLQADQFVETAMGAVETDLSRRQIFALAALFRDVQPEQMLTASLAGVNENHRPYYFRPDPEKVRAQVDWLLKGDEAAANRLTVVAVQNGTAVRGAARHVADLLRDQGFDAKSMNAPPPSGSGDAGGEVASTRVVYGKAVVKPRADRIRALLNGGTVVKESDPAMEGVDVMIVLGRDLAPQFAERKASL